MTADISASIAFLGDAPAPGVGRMAIEPAARIDSVVSPLDRIMQRYSAGEASAFGELYEALAPRLHRFCLRLMRQRTEADDLFQDALLRLHRARASYIVGAPALHWAFAIARSAYLDRVRHRLRRPEDPFEGEGAPSERSLASRDSSPESDACARDLGMMIEREMARMSEKNRSAYILLREEELSVSEAAAVLGTTCDVVKQRAHRASDQIRAALREAGWDGGPR